MFSLAVLLTLLGCAGSAPQGEYLDDYEGFRRSMLGDYWYRLTPGHPLHVYHRLWVADFDVAASLAADDSAAARRLARSMRAELAARLDREGVLSAVLEDDGRVDLYLHGMITRYSGRNRTAQMFGAGAPRAQIEARVMDGATQAEVARIVALPAEVIPYPGTLTFGEGDRYSLSYRAVLAFFDFFRIERERAREAARDRDGGPRDQ